jgi:nucleotide-binding universal stress UspA family protein
MTGGTLDRVAPPPAATTGRRVKPVMLLTLNVELEEPAVKFAIESAGQTGAELWICDAIPLEYRNYVGHVARQYAEQIIRKHLDAVARRARESGVRTTQVAFHSPRPVKVALEVAQEEEIGLLVFGADRKELGKRYFRKAVKRIRADAPCLVWIDE